MNDRDINELVQQQVIDPKQARVMRQSGVADVREMSRLRAIGITLGLVIGGWILVLLASLYIGYFVEKEQYITPAVMMSIVSIFCGFYWFRLVARGQQLISELLLLAGTGSVAIALGSIFFLFDSQFDMGHLGIILGLTMMVLLLLSMLHKVQRVAIYLCIGLNLLLVFNLPEMELADESTGAVFIERFYNQFRIQGYMLIVLMLWVIVSERSVRRQPLDNPFTGALFFLWFGLVGGSLFYFYFLSIVSDSLPQMMPSEGGEIPHLLSLDPLMALGALLAMGGIYWQLSLTEKLWWSVSRLAVVLVPVLLIAGAQVAVPSGVVWALLTLWSLSFMWQAVFYERKSWLVISWGCQTAALWSLDLPDSHGFMLRGGLMVLNASVMLYLARLASQRRDTQLALVDTPEQMAEKNAQRVLARQADMRLLLQRDLMEESQMQPAVHVLAAGDVFPSRFFINWMRSVALSLFTLGIGFVLVDALPYLSSITQWGQHALVMGAVLLLLWGWHVFMRRESTVFGELSGALALCLLFSYPYYLMGSATVVESASSESASALGLLSKVNMLESTGLSWLLTAQFFFWHVLGLLLISGVMAWWHATRMAMMVALLALFTLCHLLLPDECSRAMLLLLIALGASLIGERARRSQRYQSLGFLATSGWVIWALSLTFVLHNEQTHAWLERGLSFGIGVVLLWLHYRVQVMQAEGSFFAASRKALFIALPLPLLGCSIAFQSLFVTLITFTLMLHAVLSGRYLWFWMSLYFMVISCVMLSQRDLHEGVVASIFVIFLALIVVAYRARMNYLERGGEEDTEEEEDDEDAKTSAS